MYPDLLVKVKFYIVSHHFPDVPDKFAGTVPKGVIVCTALSHLGIVICLEGGIVFYNIMSCVYKCIPKDFGSTLGHSGFFGIGSFQTDIQKEPSRYMQAACWC